MNKFVATLSLIVLCSLSSSAQTCNYYDTVHQVRVESKILYGIDTLYNHQTDSLFMDIYKPIGDEKEFRPVMIWIFGGGFFQGNREAVAPFCRIWAQRGYVSVAIDYRLGFHTPLILGHPFSLNPAEPTRAGYRAMQDAKGAIRFLKGRHMQDSSDLQNFFIGGFSAGSLTALASQFVDDASEKPPEAYALSNAGTIPPSPRPDLGPIEGRLNINGFDSKCKGLVNFFGGVLDTAIISGQEDLSIYSYHQTGDPIVPCGNESFYHTAGFGIAGGYPDAFGSCAMQAHFNQFGYAGDTTFYIHQGNGHAVHDPNLIVYDRVGYWLQEQICGYITPTRNVNTTASVQIFPNPSRQGFEIKASVDLTSVACYDLTGKEIPITIQQLSPRHLSATWPAQIAPGMYLLDLGSQMVKVVKTD